MFHKVFKYKTCKKLEDQSLEELRQQRNTLIGLLIGLAITYLFIVGLIIWKGKDELLILMVTFIAGSYPSVEMIARIEKEIRKKNNKY